LVGRLENPMRHGKKIFIPETRDVGANTTLHRVRK